MKITAVGLKMIRWDGDMIKIWRPGSTQLRDDLVGRDPESRVVYLLGITNWRFYGPCAELAILTYPHN